MFVLRLVIQTYLMPMVQAPRTTIRATNAIYISCDCRAHGEPPGLGTPGEY